MGKRYDRNVNSRAKAQTNKIVSKLTYSPAKHENKKLREMRATLQKRRVQEPRIPRRTTTLKFGSFNVNGLDLEVGWTIQQILKNRGFDVSYPYQHQP